MLEGIPITSLVIVGFGILCLAAFALRAKHNAKKNEGKYRWQPEQDYDVVMHGETPMTPGFPTLVPRDKKLPQAETSNQNTSPNTEQ